MARTTKTCNGCDLTLDVSMFSIGRAICKPCRNLHMKHYYKDNREACIHRAGDWAKANPQRKREINEASNLKRFGTRFVKVLTSDDHKEMWDRFRYDYSKVESADDLNVLCRDFIDSHSSKVISLPMDIETILADYFDPE